MTSTDALPDVISDITGSEEVRSDLLPTARDLYFRWERQQWSVAKINMALDAQIWSSMRPFYRTELLNALAELEVGEVCVTQTLSSLVDRAPTEDDRIYLCTQLADEGRHVRFFQTYLQEAAGISLEAPGDVEAFGDSADYTHSFAPELRRVTSAVWQQGDRESWYEALVYYHLITEGVLAATALRTTRQVARRLQLPALLEGLTNVTRDESRHVCYGIVAARDGVAAGYREVMRRAYLQGIDLAAFVLVGPLRRQAVPVVRPALAYRAQLLEGGFAIARDRVVRQLANIGLGEISERAGVAWDDACQRALDAYQERWGTPHPVRAAAAAST